MLELDDKDLKAIANSRIARSKEAKWSSALYLIIIFSFGIPAFIIEEWNLAITFLIVFVLLTIAYTIVWEHECKKLLKVVKEAYLEKNTKV